MAATVSRRFPPQMCPILERNFRRHAGSQPASRARILRIIFTNIRGLRPANLGLSQEIQIFMVYGQKNVLLRLDRLNVNRILHRSQKSLLPQPLLEENFVRRISEKNRIKNGEKQDDTWRTSQEARSWEGGGASAWFALETTGGVKELPEFMEIRVGWAVRDFCGGDGLSKATRSVADDTILFGRHFTSEDSNCA